MNVRYVVRVVFWWNGRVRERDFLFCFYDERVRTEVGLGEDGRDEGRETSREVRR